MTLGRTTKTKLSLQFIEIQYVNFREIIVNSTICVRKHILYSRILMTVNFIRAFV